MLFAWMRHQMHNITAKLLQRIHINRRMSILVYGVSRRQNEKKTRWTYILGEIEWIWRGENVEYCFSLFLFIIFTFYQFISDFMINFILSSFCRRDGPTDVRVFKYAFAPLDGLMRINRSIGEFADGHMTAWLSCICLYCIRIGHFNNLVFIEILKS